VARSGVFTGRTAATVGSRWAWRDAAPIARWSIAIKRAQSSTLIGGRVNTPCERRAIPIGTVATETHAHGQVHWQARHATVATTEALQAGALAAIAAGFTCRHRSVGHKELADPRDRGASRC
jgi:hypothetical protein